jgi:putative transposase
MSTIAQTLKLPFLRLNQAKAEGFAYLQVFNTSVANNILAIPKGERRMLTLPQRA